MSPGGCCPSASITITRVAPRRQQTGQDGRLVAEVSREAKPAYARMGLPQVLDLPPRPVGASVIHDQDLDVVLRDRRRNRRDNQRQRRLLVVGGQHD